MKTKDRYYIELCGQRYECFKYRGMRYVEADGTEMNCVEFVDWLNKMGKWDQLCELAKYGHQIWRGQAR